jgi:transcriptional regulator with GAF, ATPase, and Fis domain
MNERQGPISNGDSRAGGRPESRQRPELSELFVHSEALRAVQVIIEEVADCSATVLIRGESGVGKDLVARAIVSASRRPDQPFVKVNCAALPAELLESELFGHERGAFTGAYQRKLGKFEFAQHGTLFLDEIGELPLPLQAKLLHVLQDREFFRIGGRELVQADTRIVASTNRDLEAALRAGQFREDLYYRLNVVELHVPPLRERVDEIPALVAHFLAKFSAQGGRRVEISPATLDLFTRYHWPGNVRELENLVRRLVMLGHVAPVYDDIVSTLTAGRPAPAGPVLEVTPAPGQAPAVFPAELGLREIGRHAAVAAEKKALSDVLQRVRWNRKEAARALKVSYKTLLVKIAEYGLDDRPARRAASAANLRAT